MAIAPCLFLTFFSQDSIPHLKYSCLLYTWTNPILEQILEMVVLRALSCDKDRVHVVWFSFDGGGPFGQYLDCASTLVSIARFMGIPRIGPSSE
jgi:hypothetical protein